MYRRSIGIKHFKCEWNPFTFRPAMNNEAHAIATIQLTRTRPNMHGTSLYRLCKECSEWTQFDDYGKEPIDYAEWNQIWKKKNKAKFKSLTCKQ